MSCTFSSELIDDVIAFHGHSCPGLAIGIRAAELAIRELGSPKDVRMVAVSETDMCGVDAIQFLTGCTYGKGNFIHRDYGKIAFSFFDRNAGKGLRAVLEVGGRSDDYAGMRELMGKDAAGTATDGEIQRLRTLRADMKSFYMDVDLDEMFCVKPVESGPPRPAAILESLVCAKCGELVMESRTRRFGGETYCIPCFAEIDQKI